MGRERPVALGWKADLFRGSISTGAGWTMKEQGISDEAVGELPLFGLLADATRFPTSSLLALSGDTSLSEPNFRSGLTERIAEAWTTPLPELTGAQVRVLVGQKLGLRWLAAPVSSFLHQNPRAECDLYPGDLMCAALHAHDQFLLFAPREMRAVLSDDFEWMEEEFASDRDGGMLREAMDDLKSARSAVGRL